MTPRPAAKHAAPRSSRRTAEAPRATALAQPGGRHRATTDPGAVRVAGALAPRVLGVAALTLAGAGALSSASTTGAGPVSLDGYVQTASAPASTLAASRADLRTSRADLRTSRAGAAGTRTGPERRVERAVRVSRDAPRPRRDAGSADSGPAAKPAPASWQSPIAAGGYRLTSTFGECSALWSQCHTGLDFSAPAGTPVTSVAEGVVTEAAYAGAYGNRIIVTLGDGSEVWFCHLSSFSVAAGQAVAGGQQLGAVGSTGNTTGAHLHLEVRPGGGDAVDPHAALTSHGVTP